MTVTIDEDRLSETFAALANSTRLAILARLAVGAATVNELAEPFEMTLPAISKHIKVLEQAGLVTRGQKRPVPALRHRRRPPRGGGRPGQSSTGTSGKTGFDRLDDYLAQLRPQREEVKHDD